LTGGFPCQSFSVVAQNPKRLGYNDVKGKLFFEMCRILKEKQPKVFVAENVKGLISSNKGETFPLIIKEFEKAGYHVKYKILNASHLGVPQKRERVFIVGFKDKAAFERFQFPEATTLNQPVTLAQILQPESEVEDKYYFSEKAVQGMMNTKHAKTMNKGRAQKLDQPCNTVGAHLAKVSLNSTDPVLCINGRYRMFTPREVARIQSFPEEFNLPGSKTTSYKALGNAVAPVVMWHVTNSIIEALDSVEPSAEAANNLDKLKTKAKLFEEVTV
jgi:DNA (cytosine-5)-methyltransferase 1